MTKVEQFIRDNFNLIETDNYIDLFLEAESEFLFVDKEYRAVGLMLKEAGIDFTECLLRDSHSYMEPVVFDVEWLSQSYGDIHLNTVGHNVIIRGVDKPCVIIDNLCTEITGKRYPDGIIDIRGIHTIILKNYKYDTLETLSSFIPKYVWLPENVTWYGTHNRLTTIITPSDDTIYDCSGKPWDNVLHCPGEKTPNSLSDVKKIIEKYS